ncbi:unnamed protein product [Clonostachys chloroleuca]|uniref:LIP-domain-containing protein n=1 Tax=Clonostachys chloroleuca TaxID=1926264 RepID=A0AA35MDJ1_9HYPO|nr:unnamed protein product [Clonostachys chloroleuca]
MVFQYIFLLASLCPGLLAATSSTPTPPSQDPWYTAPIGYENVKPGTVLRLRHALGNLADTMAHTSTAYNVLFRTTNSQYKPTWAVTTVLVPELGLNSTAQSAFNQSALLSYYIPYDTSSLDSSPSYTLYGTQYAQQLDAALALGLFVSVPDYEGPLAAFTAGVNSGHASIDSIRAVLSLGLGMNTTSARVAHWGYSGGALAAEWASELMVQYAPELSETIVGAALGGLTPNVSSVYETVSGGGFAGLVPSSLLGLTAQYPEAREYLTSQLKDSGPYNNTGFLAALKMSVDEAGVAFAGHDIGEYFQNGFATFQSPIIHNIINRDGVMGYHGVPQTPIFSYAVIQDEDALVDRYCQVGANILHERNSVGSHLEEAYNSASAALSWLTAVLSGSYAAKYNSIGCTIRNVTRNGTTSAV